MPTGISLHIGVNTVNQNHYLGLSDLKAAVNDAKDYQQIAKQIFGYAESTLLVDRSATTHNVKSNLSAAAEKLHPGDIFFISYSGHGGLVEDPNYRLKGDEPYDQTWCLYDRQLLDDELFEAFKKFRKGVRILVISDSCHSGSVTRNIPGNSNDPVARLAREENAFAQKMEQFLRESGLRSKELPASSAQRINARHADLYGTLQEKYKRNFKTENIGASVRLFAACQDNQITYDGEQNGRFTGVIKQIIYSGEWQRLPNAQALINRLRQAYAFPTPNYFSYGAENLAFDHNFPLKIQLDPVTDSQAAPIPSTSTPDNEPITEQPDRPRPSSHLSNDYEVISLSFPSGLLLQELTLKIVPPQVRVIKAGNSPNHCLALFKPNPDYSIWDIIHQIAGKADDFGIQVDISPAEEKSFPISEQPEGTRAAGKGFEYMPMWPPVSNQSNLPLGWHLGKEYSQLGPARDQIWQAIQSKKLENTVRIAHIDTGWWPEHPALRDNPNIQKHLARSFIQGEEYENADAIDRDILHPMEQQMHGIGTIGLISGWKLDKAFTFDEEIGYIGAAPFLEVIPIRVTESVIILNPDSIAAAIDYAIKMNCQVITMSLGGKPNRILAKAINRAYEAGVTFVSAAGNSIIKGGAALGPRTLIYPARYDRVLAACGVAQNHYPYDFKAQQMDSKVGTKSMDTRYMQGNWGPAPYMRHALAAYTPNVPWLSTDPVHPVKKNGGGTSSATPQVATAAALWLLKYQKELKEKGYTGTWRQVEAVRHALYQSAKPGPFAGWEKYFGQGIIQAQEALGISVPEADQLQKAPKAQSSWAGLTETATLLFNRRRSSTFNDQQEGNLLRSLELEMQSLLAETDEGQELLDQMANGSTAILQRQVMDYLKQQGCGSAELLGYLME